MHKLISCSFFTILFALSLAVFTATLTSPLSHGNYIDQGFMVFMAIICLVIAFISIIQLIFITTKR